MRKIFAILVVTLSTLGGVSAQSAESWLAELKHSLGSRYAMNISVAFGGEAPVDGFIMVDGVIPNYSNKEGHWVKSWQSYSSPMYICHINIIKFFL